MQLEGLRDEAALLRAQLALHVLDRPGEATALQGAAQLLLLGRPVAAPRAGARLQHSGASAGTLRASSSSSPRRRSTSCDARPDTYGAAR